MGANTGRVGNQATFSAVVILSFPQKNGTLPFSRYALKMLGPLFDQLRQRTPSGLEREKDSVPFFPRPVGAILMEQNDEWAVSRRYMSLETLAEFRHPDSSMPLAIPAA